MAKSTKYVYLFGNKKADGNGTMKALLGGKGANLAEMTRIGLPVPPGFTISTEVCTYFYDNKRTYPKDLQPQIKAGVAHLEKILGKKLGDLNKPLLVSVRSGARDSMPGMMDTILNLGLNDQTVQALAKASNNERFAWDCYRRFVQMYGDVVMGVQKRADEHHDPFEAVIDRSLIAPNHRDPSSRPDRGFERCARDRHQRRAGDDCDPLQFCKRHLGRRSLRPTALCGLGPLYPDAALEL